MISYQTLDRIESLKELRKYDMALKELADLLVEYPESAEVYTLLGSVLLEKEEYDKGKEALLKAINIDPNWAEAHNLLGGIYLQKGNIRKAETCILKALELFPENAVFLGNFGRVYLRKGDFKQVIHYSQQGLHIDPNNEFCLNNLFWAYSTTGNRGRANRILEENLKNNPENLETLSNLGFNLQRQGDYKEAEEVYSNILKLNAEYEPAINGFKESSSFNNPLSLWANRPKTEKLLSRTFSGIILLAIMAENIGLVPSRFYWIFLLLLIQVLPVQAFFIASGKWLAYKRQPFLRSQFYLKELIIASLVLTLFLGSWVLIAWVGFDLIEDGPFPLHTFIGVIYLALGQFYLGLKVDDDGGAGYKAKLLLILTLGFAVSSFFLVNYWWISFSLAISGFGWYILREVAWALKGLSFKREMRRVFRDL